MAEIQRALGLGDEITVQTMRGRDNTVIGRMPDGMIILFDKKSSYFNLLAPSQSVDCRVVYIHENFVIVDPISEPEDVQFVHFPEIYVDDIVDELEKMIETLSGNAKVLPRAILKLIRLQQLTIRILTGEAYRAQEENEIGKRPL